LKARLVAVIFLAIVLVGLFVYEYQVWNGPLLHTTYNLGSEVKNFPVTELSLTFCNMTVSKTTDIPNVGGTGSGLPRDSNYVIITVAVKNLEDTTLYFNRASDFTDEVRKAQSYNFALKYGQDNQEALPKAGYSGLNSYEWHWAINMLDAKDITALAPHQTVYGSLIFVVGEYYTVNQLICRDGFVGSNPVFAVNLK
jgi:hypothetical protein